MKLYVEGGGDTANLKVLCRQGFASFVTAAGVTKRPRIVACGGRNDAYESFCTAIANGEEAMLLVDSECAIEAAHQSEPEPAKWHPWEHLKVRIGDGWNSPDGTTDTQCHLMVQVMETWFLADRETLVAFFGQGFRTSALPSIGPPIEDIPKSIVYETLAKATARCKTKAPYGKGEHSFKLLALIDPSKVVAASPWAKRFIDALQCRMDSSGRR